MIKKRGSKRIVKRLKIEEEQKIENVFENFTEDIQCHWRIIRSPLDINLINVSYFRRREGAKKANLYFKGLIKLFYLMRDEFKTEFKLRVYHDISTKKELYQFYEKLDENNRKYMELFQYDIPKLYDGDDGEYHRATIGTLFRFLPMFNLKEHQVPGKIKVSLDIDNHEWNILFIKIFKDLMKKDIFFSYNSHLNYFYRNYVNCLKIIDKNINMNNITNKELEELSNDNFYYFGIAGSIYQKNELDSKLFYQFCKRFIYPISNRNRKFLIKICYDGSENKKEHLQYGIDEIFLNKYMIPEQFKICNSQNINEKISIVYFNPDDQNVYLTYISFIYKIFNLLSRKEISVKYKLLINIFLTELFGMSGSLKIWEKNGIYNPVKMEWKFEKIDRFIKSYSKDSELVYDKLKSTLRNKNKIVKIQVLIKNCFSESGMYSYLVPNLKRLYNLLDSLNYQDRYLMLTYKDHKFEKELIKFK